VKNLVPRNRLFHDRFDYRRDLDRVFGRVSSGGTFDKAPPSATSAGSLPATESDIDKNAQTYHCRVSLPGVDPRIIVAREQGETATIRGERKAKHSDKDAGFHCEEITHGSFDRTFALPEGVDTDQWECGIPERRAGVEGACCGCWAATRHSSEHRTEIQANRGLRACFRRRTFFRGHGPLGQLHPSPPAARKTRL
jgi:HSP20 family molecular chaperone IbpA